MAADDTTDASSTCADAKHDTRRKDQNGDGEIAGVGVAALASKAVPKPGKSKPTAKAKAKKRAKKKAKKPDGMPRRPLSAYNLFFREQRAAILAERDEAKVEAEGTPQEKGLSLFCMLGKMIAQRWKEIDEETRDKYKAEAGDDMMRYRKEMDEYQQKLAKQTRVEHEDAMSKLDSQNSQDDDDSGQKNSNGDQRFDVAVQQGAAMAALRGEAQASLLFGQQQQFQALQQQQQLAQLQQQQQAITLGYGNDPSMLSTLLGNGPVMYGQIAQNMQLQQQQQQQQELLLQQQLMQQQQQQQRDLSGAVGSLPGRDEASFLRRSGLVGGGGDPQRRQLMNLQQQSLGDSLLLLQQQQQAPLQIQSSAGFLNSSNALADQQQLLLLQRQQILGQALQHEGQPSSLGDNWPTNR